MGENMVEINSCKHFLNADVNTYHTKVENMVNS